MAVAFLILAHRGASQTARLASRLLSEQTSVHLHIDKRASAEVYRDIVAALPQSPAMRLVPRVASAWASWGIVDATLTGLRSILNSGIPADHIAIMSGQCYPLRSPDRIADFLSSFADQSFAASWPMPSHVYDGDGGMYRLRYWHMAIRRRRFRLPVSRKFPADLRPYGGSDFMVLARSHARRLLEFTDARTDIVRFHRHVWIPSEHYTQTVLRNLVDNEVINENLWHTEWVFGAKHPKLYETEDFPRLADAASNSSEAGGRSRAKFFARKFDLERDPRLLDLIDQQILGSTTL
jgi:Core-2/I-Branching enzyme